MFSVSIEDIGSHFAKFHFNCLEPFLVQATRDLNLSLRIITYIFLQIAELQENGLEITISKYVRFDKKILAL